MNVETAQRLADLRRSKGFSQEGLARKLGLSRQAVSKWERAESSPDTENLISLAKLYGVSLDELLNPSDEIEDDIEFENEDRARQREAEAAERARTHEAAARATEAATQASDAAAKAAQAASWSAQAANAATAQATSGTAVGSTPVKGPFQSFPYWAVCWLLFFLLMFLFGECFRKDWSVIPFCRKAYVCNVVFTFPTDDCNLCICHNSYVFRLTLECQEGRTDRQIVVKCIQ